MDALIQQLRSLGYTFKPPCTEAQISALEAAIDYRLDATLAALYRDHNGMQRTRSVPMRLMSVNEVLELFHALPKVEWLWLPDEGIRFFWTDDNSNYAGVYVSGPLTGKLCFLDHEEPDLSPVFRSIPSFYETMLRGKQQGWYDMPTDYPALTDSPEYDDADLVLARRYIAEYEARAEPKDSQTENLRGYYAFCAMNLLPVSGTDQIIPFVHDTDMWIQARACELLGKRRYEAAIPLLAEIAVNGMHNGRLAAIGALGDMGTPEAKAQLLQLVPRLEGAWKGGLIALKQYGCDFRRIGSEERFQYREPGSEEWIDL